MRTTKLLWVVSAVALATLISVTTAGADVTVESSNGTWSITALDPEPATCPGGEEGTRFAYTCSGDALDHAFLSFLASADVCDAQPAPVSFSYDGDGDSKSGFGESHASRTVARFNPNAVNCTFEVTVVGLVGPMLGDSGFSKGKKFEFAAVPVPQGLVVNPLEAKSTTEVEKWKGCVFEKVRDAVTGEITAVNILSGNCVSDTIEQSEFAIIKTDADGNQVGVPQSNLFTPPNTTLTVGGETGSTFYQYDGRRWVRVTDCADPTDPRPPCPE
jgi:hypothetical protein